MKNVRYVAVILALCMSVFSQSYAQDGTSEDSLTGVMVGAEVTDFLGTASVGIGGRYWSNILGGDLSFQFQNASFDASGTDIIDATQFSFSAGILAGLDMNRMKPHLRIGFAYSKSDDDVVGVHIKEFDLVPSIGVDFKAADHVMIGVDVLSFAYTISGDANGINIDGNAITLLNSVRVAYIF